MENKKAEIPASPEAKDPNSSQLSSISTAVKSSEKQLNLNPLNQPQQSQNCRARPSQKRRKKGQGKKRAAPCFNFD